MCLLVAGARSVAISARSECEGTAAKCISVNLAECTCQMVATFGSIFCPVHVRFIGNSVGWNIFDSRGQNGPRPELDQCGRLLDQSRSSKDRHRRCTQRLRDHRFCPSKEKKFPHRKKHQNLTFVIARIVA